MSARKDTPLRRWRRSIKKIGLLAVLAGLAPALSADSHSPAELPDNPAAVSAESALSALSDGFLYSDYLQNLPNLQTETTPVVSGFHGSFAVENRPSLLESIADNLPARIRQEAQSVPLRQWGLGWAIDSRRPEVVPALAAGGWRLANWLGKEVLLSATDKYGIQTLEFDLQSELGGRRAAIGVNALGALRQTERNAIAWQLSGFKSKDGVGGNVGGLYRWVTPDENHLLGANLFLDYEDYEAGAFNRWSLGGEWRSAWVDAFANVYRGITDSKLHKGERYYTADGYELEVNVHSPNVAWIAGALTYYNWKGENGDSDEDGVRFGLRFTPTLPLLLEVEYDDGDSRDNDWGGRIVYSGEFGGVQSPSVHRRGGEFIPRDFFFAAANREYTQRIRKVENNLPSPLPGRVIDLGQRGTTAANHADIVIRGTDITLTLDYMNAAPAHYIKEGLEFGVSVAASVTVSLAAKYTVQSAATVVTVQSTRPFAVETGAGEQIRTLFIGSTVALATNYAHLIYGRVSLSSGGASYEIRRNIQSTATLSVVATYDSFILPPAAIITVVSPLTDTKAPIVLPTLQGVRVQRFSDDPAAIPPSSGQINLADRLFNPQINGNAIAPTGGKGNYTLGIFGAPGQAAVLTVSPKVLEGYRITATLAGSQVKFDSGEDFTLTVNIPSSGNAEGVAPHILRIERDSEAGFPVPVHVNTVRFAYQRIDNLEIALHDPQSGTGDPLRFVTLGAAAVASVSVNGGDPTTRAQRIVFGDNVFSLNGDILSINAPAHGAYTVSVEVFDRFPDADLSPPMTAGLTVLFTTILAPVRGSWRFDGRELGTHATVTIHRTANPPAVTIGSLVPRGGDGNYKTHELRGTDASLVEFDGNNLVIKDSTNPAAGNGNEIDFEVVIDDTSDPNLPIARLAVPTTLTLKLFYVQVNALAAAVETPSGVSGTVLAAAAVPGAATPAASVNVSGGDGNATVRLAAGGDASFAVDSANRIVWTPRAFGKAMATLAVRDGLTGLPGGTDEQNPVVVAELIRPASLAFDGGHLTADSGLASLTVTAFFDEEIPLAARSFATLNFATGYGEMGFTDIQGNRFVEPANGSNVFVINQNARAEATPKTAILSVRYRQLPGGSGSPLITPNGHRYAVRLEAKYRPITLKAYMPDGQTEITAPVQVLTNNATVAAMVATGGRAGRTLEVLAGDFELIGDNKTTLRLTATDQAFRPYTVTLQYRDNSGGDERLTLTVNYADQTPPLVLGFAGGIGNGGTLTLHRTAAASVNFATLNIGGGLPPFVVGKKSGSNNNYELVNASGTSRSRTLYIPASVEPETGQGKSFAAEITVGDADDTASPAQSITVNVRYVKVPELALNFAAPDSTDGTGDPKTFWRGMVFPSTPIVVASVVLGGGATPAISTPLSDTRFKLLDGGKKIGLLPDQFGIHTLTVRATDSIGLTAEKALMITVRPLYEVYVGDQKIEEMPGGNLRFTVSVVAEPITSPVRIAEFRFLGDDAATHCSSASATSATFLVFQKDGAICHLALTAPQPAPNNRVIEDEYISIPINQQIRSRANFLSVNRNIHVQLAPKLALRLTDPVATTDPANPSGPNIRRGEPFEVVHVAGLGGDPTFPFSVVVASVVLGGQPGSNPQIDPIPSDSNFKLVADNKIAFVRPTRFGNHILTLRARETAGANPLSGETKLTVNVNRLYRAFVGDRELAENATGKYDITVSSAFNKEITAPLTLAQLRYIGDKAAAHCTSSSTLDSAVSNFGLVRQGAICNVVLNPSNPALTPDNQKISDGVGVAEPTSPPKAANEFYYRTTRTFNIELVPRYDPIKLTLVGAFGGGTAHEVVFERDSYFGRIVGGGGNSTDASPLTFSQVGEGDKIELNTSNSGYADLSLNLGENEHGEFKITVQANDTLDSTPPVLITATVTRTDLPFSVEDQRENIIEPVLESDLYKVAVTVYGPDTPTWGSAATLVFLNIYVPSDGLLQGTPFNRSGNRLRTQASTPLALAPGNVQTGLITVISGTDVNGNGGSPAATVEVKATFIRVPDLALAVRKPTAAATPAEPVRWFTEFASPPAASLVASLEATGGGEGTRAVITAAPPGDIFDITDENILRFAPTAKGIYTLTLAAMDNIGTTPANQTVTVAYGDPILASMKSGGHDESVQRGTLSNGGTVIFHNYFASAGRPGLTDLPIATLAAEGGFGGYTYTWQDSSTGDPGNDSGYVVVSNGILWLNRFDSGGQNAPGTGRAIESTPEFVATITVNDGFDASPPVLLSITGAAFQHRRPANKPDPENPRIQLEDGGNVFALHTDTGETPILTLGLPSTAAIDTTDGLVVATMRTGGGYGSKQTVRVVGSSSGDLIISDTVTDDSDSDDKLRHIILQNNVTNLADFPADANGESNTRSVVITYKTRYLGRDFFDSSIQEPHEATISLKFKIKKMTATRESAALIAAANTAIPDNIASGNLIREASDNTGNIDIARTDNTLTYAGLTVAKVAFSNLVRLGGKRTVSDLIDGTGLIGNANSILTVTTGSTDNEIFLKTRVPAAHVASHPFTPALAVGGGNVAALDGGFVVNATRFDIPEPLRVDVFLLGNNNSRGAKVIGPLEFLKGSEQRRLPFRWAVGAGGTGTSVKIRYASTTRNIVVPGNGFSPAESYLLQAGNDESNLRIAFIVNDAPDSSWPDGVDFSPERTIHLNFVGKDSAAEVSCGSGGTKGARTQIYMEATGIVGDPNTFTNRFDLNGGLTSQGVSAFQRSNLVYLSEDGPTTPHRYGRCAVSDGSRVNYICSGTQIRGGDVVLVAPTFKNNEFSSRLSYLHTGGSGKFGNARNLVAQRDQNAADERNINLFRVYHKPDVLKSVAPNHPPSPDLEMFLAKGVPGGQTGDWAPACQTADLPDNGSKGFYLTNEAVRTYKVSEAASETEIDTIFGNRVTNFNRQPPLNQDTILDRVSCADGGNMGKTQRFSEPIPGAGVGGNYEHSPNFNVNHWIVQSTALIDRIVAGNSVVRNFHVRHETSNASGRYSQCGLTANRDLTCQVQFPPSGIPAGSVITVRAGDVLLVAPGYPQELPATSIPHLTSGQGKFDNALNYLKNVCTVEADCGRNQYFAEKDANIMRVYHKRCGPVKPEHTTRCDDKRGVFKRTYTSESEIFIARGESPDDYEARCFTEDLPEGGSKFYLDRNFVQTYKWREAVPQRILDERRSIRSLQNRPGPVPYHAPVAPSP